MLPRIVGHGIATEAEIDVDTLEQRLIAEREQAGASYIGDMLFGAWATKAALKPLYSGYKSTPPRLFSRAGHDSGSCATFTF